MTGCKKLVLALGLAITFFMQADGQGFLHTNGKAIVDGNGDTVILKGMGLGGWMLQEPYMMQTSGFTASQREIRQKIEELIGPADTELFYDTWLANHVQKVDIDSLKAWGFNSVRLPMHYNLFTLPVEEEPVSGQHTWLDKGFELTDSLISWCAQNEMYVVLDLHAAPGGQGYETNISDYDPSKPSLWESLLNRKKTVALWQKLAERYANEPWVAGYDLINEPNWNLPGNTLLRTLYGEITDAIRAVDNNHILFIEGNWFANDFTGLTPPWDDNMVYSPHKYWSFNDQASIQWVLDIRDTYDVPLYLGESGENSNTWFRDAIKLLDEHQIGWAWWPMKKIESIAGPLFIEKTPEYQTLLNYWGGSGAQPGAAYAKAALMEMAERFKLENCKVQRDVLDAMFRQVYDDEAIPYHIQTIPGVVHPTDFDLGAVGAAYHDLDLANYNVSTGNYTAWNQGWAYRNDGVDIEPSNDNVNTNGYHIGWIAAGEWMQYSVGVAESALYDVQVRVASGQTGGKFHLAVGEADISGLVPVPSTGGWQNWQTLTISNVVLDTSDKKLRFYADAPGFNLGSLNFIQKAATTTIPAAFLSAVTLDANRVQLNLNKPLAAPIPASPAGFSISVNGSPVAITETELNAGNTRIIVFTVDHDFKSSEVITISYAGSQITALDGTVLGVFSNKPVQNTIAIIHSAPGKVQAEDFFFQSGISLETTTDVGGGQNIGYLDAGDYLDYYIDVAQDGLYRVDYRVAAATETGGLQMRRINADGTATVLQTIEFAPTGGWQIWTTKSRNITLTEGLHHIRIVITKPQFNLNWFEFTSLVSAKELIPINGLKIFPNPGAGLFSLQGTLHKQQNLTLEVYDLSGNQLFSQKAPNAYSLQETLDLTAFPSGQYLLTLRLEDGTSFSEKIIKTAD